MAYVFARKNFWGKDVLDAVLTLPMVMPPTVLGYYLLVRDWPQRPHRCSF